MVPKDALQLDIFVTSQSGYANRPPPLQSLYGTDDITLLPPRPQFAGAGHSRRGSSDSVGSDMSQNNSSELAYLDPAIDGAYLDDDSSPTADILDLTNYEDEEDTEESPAQQELSSKLQKEGKVRRARSRRANKGRHTSQTLQHTMRYPPTQPTSALPYMQDRDSGNFEELQQTPRASQYSRNEARYDPPQPTLVAPQPGHAYRMSMASSVGPYSDPFGDSRGRFSPSPSLQTVDYDAKSYRGESPFAGRGFSVHSRQSSMVFMEGAHGSQEDNSVDAGLWLESTDYHSMSVIAEMARLGRPKLDVILQEEIDRARGTLGVGSKFGLIVVCPIQLTSITPMQLVAQRH